MAFFLPTDNVQIWGGIYACIIGVIVAVMQSGLTPVNRLLGFLLETYYWRATVYIAFSIGCFFHIVLIVGGVVLDLLAVAYIVVAYFFKERDYFDAASIAKEEQKQQARERLQQQTQPHTSADFN